MLVCFDKKGVLKEQLDSYGNLPRVGSQTFKIFAYFKDIDLTNYGAAYIRLQRPDLSDSAYPIMFMAQADLIYDPTIISPSTAEYFAAGAGPKDGAYPCYLFDFKTIVNTGDASDPNDDHIVNLLDTPGQWQATVTLLNTTSGAANVVGTISFNVDGPASEDEEETEISFDVITHNMATAIATKLNANSTYYIRSIDNFETAAVAGTLPKGIFPYTNITVWDRIAKAFYKIDSLTEKDDDYYYATFTKLVDFDDKLDIVDSVLVVSNINLVTLANYVDGQLFYSKSDDTYYRKDGNGFPTRVGNGAGILGNSHVLTRYVIDNTTRLMDIIDIVIYVRSAIINYHAKDYIFEAKQNLSTSYDIVAFDVYEKCFYEVKDVGQSTLLYTVLDESNRIDHVVRQYETSSVYGIDENGEQVTFKIDDIFDGYIKYFQVPEHQVTVSVIAGFDTNINGWVLTNFDSEPVTISGYPGRKIITQPGGENLTEAQAKVYMKAMTGSEFLPKYDFNKPQNSYMMLPNGQILKPQWDNDNGLVLYEMKRFADIDYVNNNILSLSGNYSGTHGVLTEDQYAYLLTKNPRVLNTSTGVFFEKQSEDSTQIVFRALDIRFPANSGVVTLYGNTTLVVTKTNRWYAFGVSSAQFYNKAKLDADFATKQFVQQQIQNVKTNSFMVVDTDEYPTLEDFLESEGEEGYIYLYPVGSDQQEMTDKGYYQYIWEGVEDDPSWFCIGTTQIDLSNFEISFEQRTFDHGGVLIAFEKNVDFKMISLVDTASVEFLIPSDVSQGWISSCTFTVGNSIPTFSLTNRSSYSVVFIVNNRKADVSAIGLNLDTNGIVECMAECNGFDIRIYMKEVTN